jgi:hypothetical protein
MKRVVDVYKDRGRELVWTYVIHLGNIDFHPAQTDFEKKLSGYLNWISAEL